MNSFHLLLLGIAQWLVQFIFVLFINLIRWHQERTRGLFPLRNFLSEVASSSVIERIWLGSELNQMKLKSLVFLIEEPLMEHLTNLAEDFWNNSSDAGSKCITIMY